MYDKFLEMLEEDAVKEAEIDEEVVGILKRCYEESKNMLAAHRDVMNRIVSILIRKETITGKKFMEIFHEEKEEEGREDENAVIQNLPAAYGVAL